LHFIRYGGAREQVLGLTLVTGTGEVLQLGTGLKKDNTGYDLKQLVIGSEGTLGFVTEVILRLQGAKAENLQVALFGVDSFAKVPEILRSCRKSHLDLHAFEFFTEKALKIVQKHKGFPDPLNVKCPYYVLLEVEEKGANLDEWFASLFETQMVLDGVVASSSEESRRMWAYRELITESIAATCHVLKNDVTVRIKDLQAFIAAVEQLSGKAKDENAVQIILFGHVGDGNIHLNYVRDKNLSTKESFVQSAHPLIEAVFGILQSFSGSISAEHGIGILKKDALVKMREPHHIEMMRKIKGLFDPNGILNPGKIFD
jgi:FAD/FMN-containing dehydrogenase